jgi:hypothetical protein
VLRRARTARDAFGDFHAGGFELLHFVWVVGEKADGAHAEGFESVGSEFVLARIVGKAELAIGFDGVESGVLEFVGFELVDEADAAAFLGKIEDDASFGFGDGFQREFELGAAVAAFGSEDIAGEALRVDADERGFCVREIAVADRDGFFAFLDAFDAVDGEAAVAGGESGGSYDVGAACAQALFARTRFHRYIEYSSRDWGGSVHGVLKADANREFYGTRWIGRCAARQGCGELGDDFAAILGAQLIAARLALRSQNWLPHARRMRVARGWSAW